MASDIPRSVLPSLGFQCCRGHPRKIGNRRYMNAYEGGEELTLGHGIATKELSGLKGNEGDERARDSEKVSTKLACMKSPHPKKP